MIGSEDCLLRIRMRVPSYMMPRYSNPTLAERLLLFSSSWSGASSLFDASFVGQREINFSNPHLRPSLHFSCFSPVGSLAQALMRFGLFQFLPRFLLNVMAAQHGCGLLCRFRQGPRDLEKTNLNDHRLDADFGFNNVVS